VVVVVVVVVTEEVVGGGGGGGGGDRGGDRGWLTASAVLGAKYGSHDSEGCLDGSKEGSGVGLGCQTSSNESAHLARCWFLTGTPTQPPSDETFKDERCDRKITGA
jgi:hypothetical protein